MPDLVQSFPYCPKAIISQKENCFDLLATHPIKKDKSHQFPRKLPPPHFKEKMKFIQSSSSEERFSNLREIFSEIEGNLHRILEEY